MFVLTIDQRDSRHHSDRVPQFLADLNGAVQDYLVLPFERTAGDELQAVTDHPGVIIHCAEQVIRQSGWYLGVGVGPIEQPLPVSSRHGRGQAYFAAREAVEQAKRSDPPVLMFTNTVHASRVQEAGVVLRMLCSIWQRRTDAGWEAVEAMRSGRYAHQRDAAQDLGISAQAFSRRLQVAYWELELEVLPLLMGLLKAGNEQATRSVSE